MTQKLFISAHPDPTIASFISEKHLNFIGPSDSAAILHPFLLRDPVDIPAELHRLNLETKRFGKKTLVLILSDFEKKYPIYHNLLLLRTSLRKSLRHPNEWPMPYLWESKHEPFVPAPDAIKPGISFCGLAGVHRAELIAAFENVAEVETNFIKRDSFWGGQPHNAELMTDFWNNLSENAYALAPRGAGNFSMRFYQAMSVGRIPVLIDTDLVLPFEENIDWAAAIILGGNAADCVEKLKRAHANGETEIRQQRCYDIYHQWLSTNSFFSKMLQAFTPTDLTVRKRKWFEI